MANYCLLMTWLLLANSVIAQSTIIYEKGPQDYEIALLDLALGHTTSDYGLYQLQEWGQTVSEDRAVASLNHGDFDVTFMVLSPERERVLLPVRIDLTRGVQGYRLFLIRRERSEEFGRVETLDELRTRYKAGFGSQWADLPVLLTNQFQVDSVVTTSTLYTMLQNNRFDFFPRGINEIWDNLEQHRSEAPDLVIEQHLALYYPLVECFVVAKSNTVLAQRIQSGLARALADGSMKRLFLKYHADLLRRANIANRKVFVLANPSLPEHGPQVDRTWWLGRP